MRARRFLPYAVLVVLLAGFGAAAWRSAAPRAETGTSIAAQLLCPACQGESVAQSQSPMAAAMRDTIAAQLAEGRSPGQIRQYFVDRYGTGILADPPHGRLGAVLWLVPLLVLGLLGYLGWRARRTAGPARATAAARRWSPRYWDIAAAGLVAMVAVVAVASPRSAPPAPPSGATETDLGRSLEAQGRYAEAADVYRDAVTRQPDDDIRLRLAFDLLRADQAGEAGRVAQQVLTDRPADTQALLLLGLAQRATGSPAATTTLRRFLAAAPNDPAAAQVRRLLAPRG
ncbi:cytochrome c-type biogenesis protein CcmH [Actinoplanes sp. KI2]|uniref:cytochrome c-type biogenesis protein CcmH n=1 Tax=Actinoplanes sp. KI2 TaxID=2983315 RepID=UPI0021D5EE5F|nr:cytochrome c-type biogenesis protein CcmH [Actinoplanes sp. KI2]MCU7730287.1 cytochrome c-type biogenesis protein CcmH [Actinoplanes sp. KI2]